MHINIGVSNVYLMAWEHIIGHSVLVCNCCKDSVFLFIFSVCCHIYLIPAFALVPAFSALSGLLSK